MKILGVILARGGSKGIPKKNIRMVCGHPLISYSICAALNSKLVTDLIVSTDSNEIASVSKQYGATIPFLRPEGLSGDKVPSVHALHHAVSEFEIIKDKQYDYIVELPCVAPLRDHTHIDGALKKLIETGCDSVISVVCTGEKHPVRLKKIENDQIVDFCSEYPEPAIGSRRQDLKPDSFIRNGAIYSMTRKTLIDDISRHGNDSRPYIMPVEKSVNIDEPLDLKMAEFMIANGFCNNDPIKKKKIYGDTAGSRPALITTPTYFMPKMEEQLSVFFKCKFAPRADREVVADLITDAEVLICQPCPEYRIDENILRNASKLKVVASTSTGTNHIDKEYCKEHNIEVVCLRYSDDVKSIVASSEFTFGLVLAVTRQIPQSFGSAKSGRWREDEDAFRGIELRGKTIGIIGYGRIGSNNARYARAFGMNVVAYDPYVVINDPDIRQVDHPQKVLCQSDVVMICVHLDETTIGMVDNDWFNAMKSGVYFINTSRGEVIDESALLKNLKSGKITAAGLDVISDEFTSDKNTHPIIEYARNHSNLIVTPHIAGLTYDSERKALEIVVKSILEKL
jgi:phosphoglycerate dehydrogenase-like enzyme/CMP-N-acetylneuraminic acid synthetase